MEHSAQQAVVNTAFAEVKWQGTHAPTTKSVILALHVDIEMTGHTILTVHLYCMTMKSAWMTMTARWTLNASTGL